MVPSFGQQLRSRRMQRGLSLADVAHLTRISQKSLEYLETDNFAAFGNLTYARSFLRIYSRFLELDASPLLEILPHGRLGCLADSPHLTAVPEPWMATTEHGRSKSSNRVASPAYASFVMFLLLFGGAIFWTVQLAAERQSLLKTATVVEAEASTNSTINAGSGNGSSVLPYAEMQPKVSTAPSAGGRNVIKLLQKKPRTIEDLVPERSGKLRPNGID